MSSLTLMPLSARQLQIPGADRWYAKPDDPALSVMTDFREHSSITVADGATIDTALEHMKHTGVRCAFAVDEARRTVVGMITAYDIMGEKPLRHLRAVPVRREDILVKDLMTPLADWQVADLRQIEASTVAAVARLFEATRMTHIAIVENDPQHGQRLRGLLSAAKVKRLLSR
jgi:CBS-domain-containing membrane protein